ncbi:MAG TPA: ABC transporter permease subunit [Candidatus Cryosericum sp.]|nr:ABC transporter permease subunit [Candidatus Cryosericum sp.]
MNLLKRELKVHRKAFLFWSLGLFLLCFAGIVKFESYTASGSMMELINSFPRIVLAVMGAVGLDAGTLSGYTALLFYYVLVCSCIYALHLGFSAVSRESVDRTYEFLFTKPRSRARLLGAKLTAAYLYYAAFCAVNALFALLAVKTLGTSERVTGEIWLCALAVFLIGSLFLSLSTCFSAYAIRPEKGAARGNLAFLCAFLLGIVYNMLEHPGFVRLVSPMSYFPSADLAKSVFSLPYAALALALTGVFLALTFRRFERKDLL